MKKFPLAIVAVAALLVAPVMTFAPRARGGGPTVDELVERARATNALGPDLVNQAMALVADAYTYDSAWHLWESPERSLWNRRGWSHQYNSVLVEVLERLGFEVRMVHAARVRREATPWWFAGHAWVKVLVEGRWRDACASRRNNRLGDLGFVPLTRELPFRWVTRFSTPVALFPFAATEVWRSWLGGSKLADWVYRHRSNRTD